MIDSLIYLNISRGEVTPKEGFLERTIVYSYIVYSIK